MRYSFRIGDRLTTLREQDRDLPDDAAARVEALLFAAGVLRDSPSAGAEGGGLMVEVRGADGKLRVTVQISSSGEHQRIPTDDEMAQEGEGHPS